MNYGFIYQLSIYLPPMNNFANNSAGVLDNKNPNVKLREISGEKTELDDCGVFLMNQLTASA